MPIAKKNGIRTMAFHGYLDPAFVGLMKCPKVTKDATAPQRCHKIAAS
jgi:hypothetical protein